MNLTKRLYRLDEVRSAFLFCLKNRRFMEAIFWLRELEESHYGGETRRLLLVSWSMNIGLSRLIWFHEWCKNSETREGRLRLCWQLLRCSERDSSIWWLLWSGVCPIVFDDFLSKWKAIYKMKNFWDKIHSPEALQKDMKSYDIFARGVAYYLSCKVPSGSMMVLSSEEPIDLRKTLDEWDVLTIRKGRVYEIPSSCLYGMTLRGNGEDTSDEINNPAFNESPYWRRLGGGSWTSDTAKEEFFDTYFPDDIPDEWSLKEKRQSHGPGVKPVGSLGKWWRSWIHENHEWIADTSKIYEWINTQPCEPVLHKVCSFI